MKLPALLDNTPTEQLVEMAIICISSPYGKGDDATKAVNKIKNSNGEGIPTSRSTLLKMLNAMLSSPQFIEHVYESLDLLAQKMIDSAVHSEDRKVDVGATLMQFSELLANGTEETIDLLEPSELTEYLMTLLVNEESEMATEVVEALKDISPEPEVLDNTVTVYTETPIGIESSETDKMIPMVSHQCENTALQDATAVLRAINNGKVTVSKSTGLIGKPGANVLGNSLSDGDFYPTDLAPEFRYDCKIGHSGIRPFAWSVLLQVAGLVTIDKSKLKLTDGGKKALATPPEVTIKKLWKSWLKSSDFHELKRVQMLKGQNTKQALKPPGKPRRALAAALKDMPVNEWVDVDDFTAYMLRANDGFASINDEWELYVGHHEYGTLAYDLNYIRIERRYVFAFLLEYAATLGIIDVAITQPWEVREDFYDMWGMEKFSALSKYDGLHFIKLTPLGNWVLGNEKAYKAGLPNGHDSLRVLPNLEIVITIEKPDPVVTSLLSLISDEHKGRVIKLSAANVLKSISDGISLQHIHKQLELFSENELPGTVIAFFEDIDRRANLLKPAGEVKLIECYDEATALLIANNKKLQKYCMLAGTKHLAVYHKDATKFMNALRKEGMTLPASFAD